MGAQTGIEWCDFTFNPWRGCTHVSPGCEHCYAETLSKRNPGQLGTWGAGGTRVVASDSMWAQPAKWEAAARKAGERRRVFCASLADVFEDRPELVEPRRRLFRTIYATPHLDWLLLTKRPENAARLMGPRGVGLYTTEKPVPCPQPNIWIGVSVEDQRRADERIPLLLDTPAAVRFLSCEPLLGPVDLSDGLACPSCGYATVPGHGGCDWGPRHAALDWVIVGGESGPGARPMDISWARSVVRQCAGAGVPCFVKQMGSRPVYEVDNRAGDGLDVAVMGATSLHSVPGITDRKGGDPDEWPEDLRVREFPADAQ